MISNCSHDENGRYKDGKAGDQGGEWVVREWYNRPWSVVLRYPDLAAGREMAALARAAAENDHIGYDQNDRYTFWKQLKSTGDYDPAKITVDCEADCSSGVAAIIKAAGYRLGIEKLTKMSIYAYTGDLRYRATSIGFNALTESKYLESDAYLLPGDILLYDGHHTCINLDEGKSAKDRPTIYKGYKDSQQGGDWCAVMQSGLNQVMDAKLAVDGSCGPASDSAIRMFQITYGLVLDGRFGPKSWAKLDEMLQRNLKHVKTIPEGDYEYDQVVDGLYHIKDLDIWVR